MAKGGIRSPRYGRHGVESVRGEVFSPQLSKVPYVLLNAEVIHVSLSVAEQSVGVDSFP